ADNLAAKGFHHLGHVFAGEHRIVYHQVANGFVVFTKQNRKCFHMFILLATPTKLLWHSPGVPGVVPLLHCRGGGALGCAGSTKLSPHSAQSFLDCTAWLMYLPACPAAPRAWRVLFQSPPWACQRRCTNPHSARWSVRPRL